MSYLFVCDAGHYGYFVRESDEESDTSSVITTMFDVGLLSCVEFYYHMAGEEVGMLELFISDQTKTKRIFTRAGNQGDTWQREKVDVYSEYSYQLHFVATQSRYDMFDIAIDDISITGGLCESPSKKILLFV